MQRLNARTSKVKHTQDAVPAGNSSKLSGNNVFQSAMESARFEEERTKHINELKEIKLKHFQDEVRKRVQRLQKVKIEQQFQKTFQSVEAERNIIQQSSKAAEQFSARRDYCQFGGVVETCFGVRPNTSGANGPYNATNDKGNSFMKQSKQVRDFSTAARRKLCSRKVVADDSIVQDLPGGAWKSGATRDDILSKSRDSNDDEILTTVESVPKLKRSSKQEVSWHDEIACQKPSSAPAIGTVPEIYQGVEESQQQQQAIKQRALCRRMFMDIERQQVREVQRKREHQKRIQMLKQEKEEERLRVELASQQLADPVEQDEMTSSDMLERDRLLNEETEAYNTEKQNRLRKIKESNRYIAAMKSQLRWKMNERNIELPALCCCGESIWDTNPDTCANNCVFYKNPKAYAKALHCVLASCEQGT